MKSGLNKFKILVVGTMLCLFSLALYPWEKVDLINADKPFVDLSGSIGESIGNATKAYEKAHPTLIPTTTPEPTPEITPEPTPTPIDIHTFEEDEIKIIIGDEDFSGSGENVFVNNNKLRTNADLKTTLSSMEYEGKKIIIIDLYAESITFRGVKSVLEEMGLSYQVETFD